MDYVDLVCELILYLLVEDLHQCVLLDAHRPDKHTPMEEVVRAFNHLIESGQALYWGTSEWSAEEITDAWRVAEKLSAYP